MHTKCGAVTTNKKYCLKSQWNAEKLFKTEVSLPTYPTGHIKAQWVSAVKSSTNLSALRISIGTTVWKQDPLHWTGHCGLQSPHTYSPHGHLTAALNFRVWLCQGNLGPKENRELGLQAPPAKSYHSAFSTTQDDRYPGKSGDRTSEGVNKWLWNPFPNKVTYSTYKFVLNIQNRIKWVVLSEARGKTRSSPTLPWPIPPPKVAPSPSPGSLRLWDTLSDF